MRWYPRWRRRRLFIWYVWILLRQVFGIFLFSKLNVLFLPTIMVAPRRARGTSDWICRALVLFLHDGLQTGRICTKGGIFVCPSVGLFGYDALLADQILFPDQSKLETSWYCHLCIFPYLTMVVCRKSWSGSVSLSLWFLHLLSVC